MAWTERLPWSWKLHWQILAGMALGVLAGAVLGPASGYLDPVGEIFLRLLRMVVVPLVFSSLVVGTAGLGNATSVGRMGLKALVYYTSTSALAIVAGLFLVNVIRPGVGADLPLEAEPVGVDVGGEKIGETLLGIVPENPFHAMAEGNILAVIFFALVVGLFTYRLPERPRSTIFGLAEAVFDLMMRVTEFVIRLAPIGVFALMATLAGTTGFDVFPPLFLYMATVASGLALHAFVTLPLLLLFFGRVSPFGWFSLVSPALATAFSTASSSATLPVTMECVERRVPNQVSSFVLPLGATINMDGTALYEGVAALFIAQAYGIDLGFGEQAVVLVTALLASIGAAGIPMAGLVMMVIVLRAVGLPLEGVGLVLAVDRVLDMCRTAVNVWSDTVGAVVLARWEKVPLVEVGDSPE
ncbi:MAG: sodium:dicarboxylate symporter [Candidatus Binatia bacterium]|nr:MAG: sodium:dicarboxylate symporter [Candidatus Binatia bacterium]